jgi:hypothetical protein
MPGASYVFAPNADLANKANFCRHVFVELDGSITEVVRLNVLNDRHREEIIGFHFAQQYAKLHYDPLIENPQFYVVGRDCPWDFEYVLHDGTTFFVEICRIAEPNLLKVMKAENDLNSLLNKGELKGYEIQKINKQFPEVLPHEFVRMVQTKADRQRTYRIPKEVEKPKMFNRPDMIPEVNLTDLIHTAISKKIGKRHKDKDNTILILDNLTTHGSSEQFFEAIDALRDFLSNVPFPSIWLYTGYFSDDNGSNCEYSLAPIKLTDNEFDAFRSPMVVAR